MEATAVAILVAFYLLPWIVALTRKHPSSGAIFLLNLILGWTVLGWLWALIWSATATHRKIIVVQEPDRETK
ncbi:superinfection immunity protein [Marinicauda algicola]|uniref:Superinfection immunity protein n=1 Tax=Marinicauda algicola TaxID=2029849 RepID=A0A4S2H199_9PROT|nr:superinfection immunity protein [Marinicauda algicola]TGY89256.1 superinfection immunity protein [Marinicauda algicola]